MPADRPYDVHPGVAMMQKWAAELPQKTGRSLDEWLALIRRDGPPEVKERRRWLKEKHGLGTNSAWWLAEEASGGDVGMTDLDPEAYLAGAAAHVEAMFAGPKAALRPVFDELLRLGRELGGDVRVCPCKTIVPLYRRHVFAQLRPTTRTRLDLGLALGDEPLTGRLLDTGGLARKDRITRRIPLAGVADLDDEVCLWLRAAYDKDGGPAEADG